MVQDSFAVLLLQFFCVAMVSKEFSPVIVNVGLYPMLCLDSVSFLIPAKQLNQHL